MEMKTALVLLFTLLATLAVAEKVRYDNYKVMRVVPHTAEQLKFLNELSESHMGYSFWTEPTVLEKFVDILIAPHLLTNFNDMSKLLGLDATVFIENVQERIDNERPATRKATEQRIGWEDYYTLEEIYAWLEELASSYPNTVTLLNAGQTYEGRDILGVRVSFSQANANRSFFIEGGIHAREWISPAVTTYILNEILTTTNQSLRALYESYNYYIFPVFNPDGYNYTLTNRMWRKTRVPYGTCYGADPNRNWNYYWLSGGASINPCSETYAGPSPFSEPEVRSLSEFIATVANRLVGYISFHSYSQLLMLPFGHTTEHLANYDEVYPIGVRAAENLASRYGTQYAVGNIGEIIYIASGGSMDWVKGTYGTRVAFTYELRDRGQYGFLLPANQILPSSLETLDSIITILEETLNLLSPGNN